MCIRDSICSRYLENKALKPATYIRLKLSTSKEGTEFTVLSTEKFDGREKAEAARAEVIGVRVGHRHDFSAEADQFFNGILGYVT